MKVNAKIKRKYYKLRKRLKPVSNFIDLSIVFWLNSYEKLQAGFYWEIKIKIAIYRN